MKLFSRIKSHFNRFLKAVLIDTNVTSRNVKLGEHSEVKGSVIKGKINIGVGCKIHKVSMSGTIDIGNYTSLWGPNIVLEANINKIVIGNYCSIARNVIIQEYSHNMNRFSTYYINKNIIKNGISDVISKGDIKIGSDVWIGSNAVILSGVSIGTGAVIGANSIINKDIPPYAIAVGSPASIIKYRFPPEIQDALLKTKWWDWDLVELKSRIKELDDLTAIRN